MSTVFQGRDPRLGRVVAIKVLSPLLAASRTARQRFLREAQAVAAIHHKNVVNIFAIEDQGRLPYLVLEYVPGQSLQDGIDGCGPLPLEEVLVIGAQVAIAPWVFGAGGGSSRTGGATIGSGPKSRSGRVRANGKCERNGRNRPSHRIARPRSVCRCGQRIAGVLALSDALGSDSRRPAAADEFDIVRDAKGNALIRYVGGQSVNTGFYRHPEVAVGLGQYTVVFDSPRFLRFLAGGFIDLSHTFTDDEEYVAAITLHAPFLVEHGYLLEADADESIQRAKDSGIGQP